LKHNMKLALRLVPVAAALIMLICAAPGAIALFGNEEDMGPSVAAFSKTDLTGAAVSFTQEDFTSRVTDAQQLDGIVITTLPDAQAGTLTFGQRTLLAGEAVSADTLDMLSFVPAGDSEIQTSFSFIPVFASGVGKESVTVSINLLGSKNTAPAAMPVSVKTFKNVAVTGRFDAKDAEGDNITYKIADMPAKGTVEISKEDPALFKYTPDKNKTGDDRFAYTATDAFGNESEPAEITILIENKTAKISYSDMDGHPANYNAVRLAEAGIFTGEKVGDEYFFNPGQEVSRGDFIAMVMTATGAEISQSVSRTGFSDDEDIPDWIKPYVSSALRAGYIRGMNASDGSKIFCSSMNLTRAQAAVIMDNVLKVESGAAPAFADAVPAWASQAVADMAASGIITSFEDGTFRANDPITRAEAAELIGDILDGQQETKEDSGFWSWLF